MKVAITLDEDGHFEASDINNREKTWKLLKSIDCGSFHEDCTSDYGLPDYEIEDILDISIFSEMNNVLKIEYKTVSDTEKTLYNQLNHLETKEQGQIRLIEEIENNIKSINDNNEKEIKGMDSIYKKLSWLSTQPK